MSVTSLGIVISDKDVQLRKALLPTTLTEVGIVISDKEIHPWNALVPIAVS